MSLWENDILPDETDCIGRIKAWSNKDKLVLRNVIDVLCSKYNLFTSGLNDSIVIKKLKELIK